jgi:hypothetical protein
MHKTTPGSFKNAQHSMRNFEKGTKSHVELPKNAQNPMRNFQKCINSQEKLPNMHKIPRASSENAQDLMNDFK